jgi:vacuolar-type H+-ATPase subunit D/Vma8
MKKLLSVILAAVMCVSVFAVNAHAKSAKKYVKSIAVKKKASVTIPASKKSVAAVKVVGSKIKVTAKKSGKVKIKVTTKAKDKSGKKLSKILTLTVKKSSPYLYGREIDEGGIH